MAHAPTGRGGDSGDVGDNGLGDLGGDEFGRVLLGVAANFAHHHDAPGLRVRLEQAQTVDEAHSVNRVTADPDAGTLPEPAARSLVHCLVGQSTGSRHDPYAPFRMDMTRHDTHLARPGCDDAWTVRADQPGIGKSCKRSLYLQHVEHGGCLR